MIRASPEDCDLKLAGLGMIRWSARSCKSSTKSSLTSIRWIPPAGLNCVRLSSSISARWPMIPPCTSRYVPSSFLSLYVLTVPYSLAQEVIELIENFTISEIRDRIDEIFDPLTTALVNCGQACLKRLARYSLLLLLFLCSFHSN